MNEKRKIHITVNNQLNYDITLRKVMVFEGKTSGVASGFVIGAQSDWISVIEQTNLSMLIKGKYFFTVNGLLAPLKFSIKFEYLHWKEKKASIELYNSNDRVIQFGHGNIGEKIGAAITGYTEGSVLNLTVDITSSTEKIYKGLA